MKKLSSFQVIAILILSICVNLALVLPCADVDTPVMGTPTSGSISSNETWTSSGSPYWIEGDLTIESGVTLIIEEGVNVLFNGHRTMCVQGNLTAIASESSPVVFSSNRSVPSTEDWYGITVESTGHLELEYLFMSYATVAFSIYSPQNNISHCNISDSLVAMDMYDSLGNNLTNNTVSKNEFGFIISSSPRNRLDNNTFFNNSRASLLFFGASREDYSQTVTSNIVNLKPVHYYDDLNNTTISDLESGHITIVDGHNVSLENISIPNGDAISLVYSSNDSVRNCSVSGGWNGLAVFSTTHLNITNCSVADTYQGVKEEYSSDNSFFDVKSENNTEGFYILDSHRVKIIGSNISFNHERGVQLIGSTNSILEGNVFWKNRENSLWVAGSKKNFNHTIDGSNTVNGKPILYLFDINHTKFENLSVGHVTVAHCDNVTLSNISMDEGDLIYFVWTTDSSLTSSDISDSWAGVRFQFSNYNTIEGSRFTGNSDGVLAFSSEYNVLVNNTLLDNTQGIGIYFSSNNSIFRNNFLSNEYQAVDYLDGNRWDNGYPGGGNHWSDYTGTDLFSGQNQDITGSDGIGDSPYVLDSDSEDRYPLMSPIGSSPFASMAGASLTNPSMSDVTIYWRMEENLAFPNEVNRYDVYRNISNYDPNGVGYQLVASIPNGTFQFTDGNVGEGDPNDYFYYVCAVDIFSNSTCSPNQAGKFTRFLSEGNQLVSVPLIPTDSHVSTVLQTVNYEKAWFFDAYDMDDSWKTHSRSKPFNGDLATVNQTMAIWVNVIGSSNLTIAGIVPTSTHITLRAGWNFVGFPSFNSSYTVADLKSSTGSSRVEGYEALLSPYYLRELGDVETLEIGYGYWIWVDSETVWVVRFS